MPNMSGAVFDVLLDVDFVLHLRADFGVSSTYPDRPGSRTRQAIPECHFLS